MILRIFEEQKQREDMAVEGRTKWFYSFGDLESVRIAENHNDQDTDFFICLITAR